MNLSADILLPIPLRCHETLFWRNHIESLRDELYTALEQHNQLEEANLREALHLAQHRHRMERIAWIKANAQPGRRE